MKGSISLVLTVLWLASLTVLAATHEGKEVKVAGLIKMYEGKPSTDISSVEQIYAFKEAATTAPKSWPSELAS